MSAVGEECARGRPGCRRGMPGTHAHPWARDVANMVSTVTGSSARWQLPELFEEAEHRRVVGLSDVVSSTRAQSQTDTSPWADAGVQARNEPR